MPTVFVSYSRADSAFVRQLAGYMKKCGIDYWLDLERIQAGEDWSDMVWSGLQSSDLMLLVISPASMSSKEVSNEWKYYLSTDKPIVPVLAADTSNIHYQLVALHYVDFYNNTYEDACQLLKTEIERVTATLEATLPRSPDSKVPRPAVTTDLLKPLDFPDRTTAKIDPELVKEIEERLHLFTEQMTLELVNAEDRDHHIEVHIRSGREYVVGRASAETRPDIDLSPLESGKSGVSRRHATLQLTGNTLYIKDLNSTNYTYVEGRRLRANEQLALKSGDRIQMGNLLFTLHFRKPTTDEA
jgi:hypothetical protein